jgi:hypothetical protein
MRATIAVLALGLWACGDGGESAGAEAARRQAESDQKAKDSHAAPAQRLATPVPGQAHVPCAQLIDLAAFQVALGEKPPLALKDVTKTDAEAAASCSVLRGGKRPTEAEQKAMLKHASRLGVLPGDELCRITAYCSTIEDPERFKAHCKDRKGKDDESMGSYACVRIVEVGADDVKVFEFVDADTRCRLKVSGGPSNVNNDLIQSCAKVARDTIGPAQIKVDAVPDGSGG